MHTALAEDAKSSRGSISKEASPPTRSVAHNTLGTVRKNTTVKQNSTDNTSAEQNIPPVELLVSLVRNTFVTLNDANLTNNYAVFHQLSSNEAQQHTSVDALSKSFEAIRKQGTDLSLLTIASPKFSQLPTITPKGLLRLQGSFETSPTINFDLFFQKEAKQWKIYAIGVGIISVDSRLRPIAPIKSSKAS